MPTKEKVFRIVTALFGLSGGFFVVSLIRIIAEGFTAINSIFLVSVIPVLSASGLSLIWQKKKHKMPRQSNTPDCLGEMKKKHSLYCSTVCPMAARCMLLAMDAYMRKHPGFLFTP